MAKIQIPKGTRDFYPDAMRRRRTLENVWREVSLRAGFEEVDGPIFESLDLYIQKSGPEIVGQLYNFEDKGGRPVALRPEFTPSLARMVAARQAALPRPVKWFNISRVCRYERSQKGRLREFFQWNCDILGAPGIAADAECIAVAIDALRRLGVTPGEVEVRLSSRKLLAALLVRLGLRDEVIPRVYTVLDKRGKVPGDVLEKMLDGLSLTAEQRKGIDAIFAYASPEEIPVAGPDDPVTEPLDALRQLLTLLDEGYGVAEFVRFDIGIVRGLAYYTGPVWEVFDTGGQLRSLFGGGRYDNLIDSMGGQPMAACGFGAGDVTMSLLLDDLGLWPDDPGRLDVAVLTRDASLVPAAARLTQQLRDAGRAAQYGLSASAMKRQLKSASDSGARYAVLLGTDGCPAGKYRLRDMATGDERDVGLDDLVSL
jgi:histidyl-tRNA synthetase